MQCKEDALDAFFPILCFTAYSYLIDKENKQNKLAAAKCVFPLTNTNA